MSDSDDFGGLAPTTPLVRIGQRNLARTTKPSSRADPGASSKPVSGPSKGGRRKGKQPASNDSDIEEITVLENGADIPQPRPRPKKPASVAEAPLANGKGKEKAKANTAQKTTRKPIEVETIDNEGHMEVDGLNDDEPAQDESLFSPNKRRRTATKSAHHIKSDETSRLAEQLRRAEAQIESLSRQLEEVFQLRNSDAEQMLERQEKQYAAQFQAHEDLIKELSSQLSQKEPFMRAGGASVLNLITRETAEEEKKTLQENAEYWERTAKKKEELLQERDKEIAELQQREKDIQYELKLEVERSKELVNKLSRNPASVARPRAGGNDDPKHTTVVRFYEDLTNLLITNLKLQQGPHGDEWVLTCIYTFMDAEISNDIRKSMSFTLRSCKEPSDASNPNSSKDDLVDSINYIPLELDKEPQDYVERLAFLGAPFTFPRDQLPLFLRTIHTNMADAIKDESDNEDSVQLVE